MSVLPPESSEESYKNSELRKWNVPKELKGLILNNLEELKAKFPENEDFGAVYLSMNEKDSRSGHGIGFDRYSR